MNIKGLLAHFDNENNLILRNIKYNNRIEWEGVTKNLKNGSEFTYASCKVKNWYVKDNGTIIVSIEE